MICVVPMYHLYGLHIVVNLGLSQGATIVTVPRYDLDQFLRRAGAIQSNDCAAGAAAGLGAVARAAS